MLPVLKNIYIFDKHGKIKKMPIRSRENSIGALAFLAGVILAVVVGIFSVFLPTETITNYNAQIYGTLIILGALVGLMHTAGKDSQSFLLAGTAVVIVSKFGMDSVYGTLLGTGIVDIVRTMFGALLVLFVPATIIVALKSLFSISSI